MATFTKNRRTGNYDVLCPAGVSSGSRVTVTKRDGSTSLVTIDRVSKPFVAKFGPLTGRKAVLCTIAHTPRNDGSVRCRHCGERTPEGDDWCMACGAADYER